MEVGLERLAEDVEVELRAIERELGELGDLPRRIKEMDEKLDSVTSSAAVLREVRAALDIQGRDVERLDSVQLELSRLSQADRDYEARFEGLRQKLELVEDLLEKTRHQIKETGSGGVAERMGGIESRLEEVSAWQKRRPGHVVLAPAPGSGILVRRSTSRSGGQGQMIAQPRRPCESCGKLVAAFESVALGSTDGGYRHLCLACYNATMAAHDGVDFADPGFDPVRLTDVDGEEHLFHFTTRLLGDRVAIEAIEIKEGTPEGHRFMVLGFDPECEILDLYKELFEKMRRGLFTRHLVVGELGLEISDQLTVRAWIDCDLEADGGDRRPLLVIDGKPITWDHFGHMLMTFEGFQFKLEVYDPSEER